jgi:CRISPR-associated exonuclease Cas4
MMQVPTSFEDLAELKFKGTQVAYFMICKRKLWLFTKGVSMEHTSDRVSLGKLWDEKSFKGKEGFRDENVSIDFLTTGEGVVVHEVKLSKALEEAHILQVKYYLYYMKNKGVKISHGVIHYPRARTVIKVELTEKDEKSIGRVLGEMEDLLSSERAPEVINKSYCKKCAYFEFCYG